LSQQNAKTGLGSDLRVNTVSVSSCNCTVLRLKKVAASTMTHLDIKGLK